MPPFRIIITINWEAYRLQATKAETVPDQRRGQLRLHARLQQEGLSSQRAATFTPLFQLLVICSAIFFPDRR